MSCECSRSSFLPFVLAGLPSHVIKHVALCSPTNAKQKRKTQKKATSKLLVRCCMLPMHRHSSEKLAHIIQDIGFALYFRDQITISTENASARRCAMCRSRPPKPSCASFSALSARHVFRLKSVSSLRFPINLCSTRFHLRVSF